MMVRGLTLRVARTAAASICLLSGATASAREIGVDPVVLTQNVGGQPVSVPVTAYFGLSPKADGRYLDVRLQADLHDLQTRFAAIVDSFPLPRDNCASYKPDNLVVTIDRKSLGIAGETATILLAGKVDVWNCLENPVPNSKIEWKRGVPQVKTWKGDPIKNKNLSQPLEARLSVRLEKSGDRALRLALGAPDIKLQGRYVFLAEGALKIAHVNISHEAQKALERAIAPEKLIVAIPREYAELQPVVTRAAFAEKNDRLVANVGLTAKVPLGKISDFIRIMVEHLGMR